MIYAPLSGQLALDDVAVGTFAAAGNTNLVTIGNTDPVYVQFSISETDYLKVMNLQNMSKGTSHPMDVSITLSDGTVYPLTGRIAEADRALTDKTGSLTIKAIFDNPQHLLLPGMFARVKITGEVVPNAILVPQRAVQQLLGKSFVMVVGADGKSAARTVTLGDQVGSYYIIKDGLSVADTVIVEGLSNLQEGRDLSVTMVTPEEMGFSLDPDSSMFDTNLSAEESASSSKS